MDQTKLLTSVLKWGKACRLDDFEIATAQSLAWYDRSQYKGPALPESHWAKNAVRRVRSGRDLPGCGTPPSDALNKCWLGERMSEVMDRSPGPDVLAAHREAFDRNFDGLGELGQQVAKLKIAGAKTQEIAIRLERSEGRISQISREVVEGFWESE